MESANQKGGLFGSWVILLSGIANLLTAYLDKNVKLYTFNQL